MPGRGAPLFHSSRLPTAAAFPGPRRRGRPPNPSRRARPPKRQRTPLRRPARVRQKTGAPLKHPQTPPKPLTKAPQSINNNLPTPPAWTSWPTRCWPRARPQQWRTPWTRCVGRGVKGRVAGGKEVCGGEGVGRRMGCREFREQGEGRQQGGEGAAAAPLGPPQGDGPEARAARAPPQAQQAGPAAGAAPCPRIPHPAPAPAPLAPGTPNLPGRGLCRHRGRAAGQHLKPQQRLERGEKAGGAEGARARARRRRRLGLAALLRLWRRWLALRLRRRTLLSALHSSPLARSR